MKFLYVLTFMTLATSANAMSAQPNVSPGGATLEPEAVETVGSGKVDDQALVVLSNGRPMGTVSEVTNVSSALSQGGCYKCTPRQICCDGN